MPPQKFQFKELKMSTKAMHGKTQENLWVPPLFSPLEVVL